MAGRGRAPSATRRNASDVPIRGDWQAAPGIGWQHGEIPSPSGSRKLRPAAAEAWDTWMRSWVAAHWGPEDLPGLRQLIALFSKVDGGRCTASERTELRQLMDSYGITPKGQQDRRWQPPKAEEAARPGAMPASDRYAHLRVVGAG